MSEPRVNVEGEAGPESSDAGRQDERLILQNQDHIDTPRPGQLGLPPASVLSSAEPSPSPAGEGSGLLSLPWEMVARIASHLPAQCVITVLPQVCHALGNVGKDSTAWQLRARRLTGPGASFPVGPRDRFDWPAACVEMERLTACWAGMGAWAARERDRERGRESEREREREREWLEQGRREEGGGGAGEPAAEDEDRARADEGGEALAQEAGFGGPNDEAGEMPLGGGGGLAPGAREEEEEEEERGKRKRREAGEPSVERESRSPSPPPALERLSLLSGHIAEVNSVLLVGGAGGGGGGGAVCASGSRDRNVNLWDLREGGGGKLLRTLGGQGLFSTHRGWVWCLAARGPLLASGSFDSTVRLWDLGAGGAERGLIRAKAAVLCLSCQTDALLLAGTYDKKVSIYDTRVAEPLVKSLRLHSNAVLCLAADDDYIISASKDQSVAIYDRRAGKTLQKLLLTSYLLSMHYSGSELWAGDNRGTLHTFSVSGGALRPVSQFDVGHSSLVTGIHRSPGTLYTCSSDRTIKVHLPCGPPRTLCTLHHQAGVNGLSVKDGVLAIASGDMCVEVWKARK